MSKFVVGDEVRMKTQEGRVKTYFKNPDNLVVVSTYDSGRLLLRELGTEDTQVAYADDVEFADKLVGYDYTPKDIQDNVNHPKHYNNGKIECIDAMEAMAEGAEVDTHIAYLWQNAFKYLWRWPYKNGKEDLKKAVWYINRIIERID